MMVCRFNTSSHFSFLFKKQEAAIRSCAVFCTLAFQGFSREDNFMYKFGYRDRFSFFADDYYDKPTAYTDNPFPFQNSSSRLRERCRLIIAHGIIYNLQGRFDIRCEGSHYILNPGDMFIVRESEGHTVTPLDYPSECFDSSFSLHYFRIPDPEFRLYKPFTERPLGVGNVIAGKHLNHELIRSACYHIASTTDVYMRRIAVMGMLEVVLSEIVRAHKPENYVEPYERDPLTVEILDYINTHLNSDDLDPDALAAHFYVSRSQLNRMIKGGTGFTLWNYITCKRLSRAYYLIQAGVSNKDAAHMSGFQDYSTFYKAYIRVKGFSPKDDRPSESFDPFLTNFYQLDESANLF